MNEIENKHIEPNPDLMEKMPAQMMIYDGSKWLEISNQQTINKINKTTTNLQQEAKDVRQYVDNVDSDFKEAQKNIDERITTETTKLNDSIVQAKLDTKSVNDRVTQINSDSQKTMAAIQANLANIDKNLDSITADSKKAIDDLQKQANDIKLNVADQFNQKTIEIQTAKQQAIASADQALKDYQAQVTTQFSNVDGQLSQTVRKTDYDKLSKTVTANETRSIQNQNMIELKADKTSVDTANNKITDLESALSVASDQIKARAKQTDIDKLTDRVSSAEASLTVNANNISLKADKTSVDSLNQQVNNISSAMLTVNSDQIKSLVNSTKANGDQIKTLSTQTQQNANTIKTLATKTDLNTLTNTVNQAKTEWNQSANGINANISQVNSKIDNINIGGRNYLQGSLNFKWPEGVGQENVTPTFETQGDATVAHLISKSSGGIYTKWRKAFPNGELQIGDDYTMSFDAKGRGMFIAAGNESGNQDVNTAIVNTSLTSDWKRYSISGNISALNKAFVIYFKGDYDVYLKRVKIEKGNKATDYTQAPEDTVNQINAVNNTLTTYKTDLNLLKDGMSLRVAEITQVNNRLNGLQVGGTNLLYNTKDYQNWLLSGTINEDDSSVKTRVLHLWVGNGRKASRESTIVSANTIHLVKGQQYTISLKAKYYSATPTGQEVGGRSLRMFSKYTDQHGGGGFLLTDKLTDQWKKYSCIFTSDTTGDYDAWRVIDWVDGNFPGGSIFVAEIKIEEGNKATDWSPAPEDATNAIDDVNAKYSSLNIKLDSINTTVATKADKSYVDQTAANITNVVSNKADTSYVNQKANQWQVALQNAQNDLSGKITATNNNLTSLYSSDTYKGMQKIVQNSAFLQNANGFTSQVQQLIGDQLKQVNLVYNSEFVAGTDSVIDGWTTNFNLKRGTNRWDNYNGSTTLGMDASGNADDRWVNGWSSFIDVEPGETVSSSVIVFYTGNVSHTGICGLELEFWTSKNDKYRKSNKMTTVNVSDVPASNAKLLKLENVMIPNGINAMRVSLIIRGKGNVMFAHPMFVKGTSVGTYQMSSTGQISKLTQTLAGLKSEVHDNSASSVIAQTARMIALQVSGDKNKVISQINASNEGVMIDGKHVMINGNTRIQGTLMVNDVVMKSDNNSVRFNPGSLDMVGSDSMIKLSNGSIQLGSTSDDPRKQWKIGMDEDGFEMSVPVKKSGATTNNPSDYSSEIQGYIRGGGWDYSTMETVGNGASGIEIGLMTKQVWNEPYGGDYFAIGQYVPSASGRKILQPAFSYSETGAGWAKRDIHLYKPTYFEDEVHFGAGSAQNGIRTAWVSWSDWGSEKYPCFVNDGGNWGGIAFPKNGNVVLFNNAGYRYNIYETKSGKIYNNYGGY